MTLIVKINHYTEYIFILYTIPPDSCSNNLVSMFLHISYVILGVIMKNELLITYIAFTLNNIAFFVQQFNLPFLAKKYGLSDATFGIFQTFFGVLQILGGPAFGILTNKFGLKASIHICNLMIILTYLLLLVSDVSLVSTITTKSSICM